ncbi:MAG: 4Fe-4S binding protein [Candidatus Marinimicrobia bacterium]|nr:4Fe-4S binding protein [Candidatus Neomarinimicrobiota bacterium]
MKKITSKTWRKTSQIFFFLLFFLTVLQATYPFEPWLPPELFLWFDPLVALAVQIAGRFFAPVFLLSLVFILFPMIFGRAFCGWICPFGTVIDATDRLISQKKIGDFRKVRPIKTFLLVIFLMLALFGVQYSWTMDPLPILWRSLGVFVLSFGFLIVDTILNGFVSVGIFPNVVMGIQDSLSGYLFPVDMPDFENLAIPVLLFFTILGLSRIARRFWCRTLCPLGALQGIISKIGLFRRKVDSEKCTACGLCRKKCKMDAIEPDFIKTEKSECVMCLSCKEVCPTNAISFGFDSPEKRQTSVDLSRRSFIGAGATALVGAGLFAMSKPDPNRTSEAIRPPGTVIEPEFLKRCIRCEECVRICATSGGCLQMSLLETGMMGIWTPVAKFRSGHCEFNCNLCGQICPTKAIQPLELKEKQEIRMGTAIFIQDRCIPYRLNDNCIVCEEHCPVSPKAIRVDEKEIFDPISGQKRIVRLPYIDPELCIGCGICEEKCPLEGKAGICVVREGEERIQV